MRLVTDTDPKRRFRYNITYGILLGIEVIMLLGIVFDFIQNEIALLVAFATCAVTWVVWLWQMRPRGKS